MLLAGYVNLTKSTYQPLSVGAPKQVLDSCNSLHPGATQEGVAQDRAQSGPERGGYFPP
jgi:hypothetical protein